MGKIRFIFSFCYHNPSRAALFVLLALLLPLSFCLIGTDCAYCCLTNYPDCNPLEDTYFVTDPNGRNVATSTVIKHADGKGYVHMVANIEECRGLGIGHAMLAFGAEILLKRGCKKITLTTDDFRLAAIKTYLDGGFCPVMWQDDDSDMKARWDAVIEKMHYTRSVTYVDDDE